MALTDAEQRGSEDLGRLFPAVPARIITSVFAAYRRVTPTVADAVRAARGRIDDAREVMSSSVGSHVEDGLTSVAVYLTQHDVDQLQLGLPVDLDAPDDRGGTLLVHVRRERRRQPRPLAGSAADPAA